MEAIGHFFGRGQNTGGRRSLAHTPATLMLHLRCLHRHRCMYFLDYLLQYQKSPLEIRVPAEVTGTDGQTDTTKSRAAVPFSNDQAKINQ